MVDSVRFPPNIGGSGRTYTSDANPETGMFNGGHRTNFFPMLEDTVQAAGYVSQYVQAIDGAKANADKAEDARGFVEGYAGALKNNIVDYYRQKATLDLDFSRGIYRVNDEAQTQTTHAADVLTVTRSTPKWVEGPDGFCDLVNVDELAREWRSGLVLGGREEETRSNLFLWSNDFTNSYWLKDGDIDASLVSGSYLRGESKARLNIASSGGLPRVRRNIEVVEGQVYTISAVLESTDSDSVPVIALQADTGVSSSVDVRTGEHIIATGSSARISTSGYEQVVRQTGRKGVWLLSISFIATTTALIEVRIRVQDSLATTTFTGNGSQGIFAHYAQMEKGGYVTSFIKTTSSTTTRTAGLVSITNAKIFNNEKGTLIFKAPIIKPNSSTDFGRIFSLNDGTDNNRLYLVRRRSGSYDVIFIANGTRQSPPVLQDLGDSLSLAISWSEYGLALSVNGVIFYENIEIDTFTGLSRLQIGETAGSMIASTVMYIPNGCTASELQELTK